MLYKGTLFLEIIVPKLVVFITLCHENYMWFFYIQRGTESISIPEIFKYQYSPKMIYNILICLQYNVWDGPNRNTVEYSTQF